MTETELDKTNSPKKGPRRSTVRDRKPTDPEASLARRKQLDAAANEGDEEDSDIINTSS